MSVEDSAAAAGQAIVIACRNFRDPQTLGEALHVITRDLENDGLSAVITYLSIALHRSLADSVWRAAHDAEAGCEWDGRDEHGGQQWCPRL